MREIVGFGGGRRVSVGEESAVAGGKPMCLVLNSLKSLYTSVNSLSHEGE